MKTLYFNTLSQALIPLTFQHAIFIFPFLSLFTVEPNAESFRETLGSFFSSELVEVSVYKKQKHQITMNKWQNIYIVLTQDTYKYGETKF